MKKLILIGMLLGHNVTNATEIGDKVWHCNFNTGQVEESTVIAKDNVPAIDNKNLSLVLDNNLVISEYDVIKGDYTNIKILNCI